MTLDQIKQEMKNEGIPTTGSYESFALVIKRALVMIESFDYNYWESKSTMGSKTKDLVKRLSNN